MDRQDQDDSRGVAKFLSGGGDMGRSMRAHDWSASPLGRPESWAPSLQTAVKLLLGAHAPIAVGWGPELMTLHNDAFAGILGASNPQGVGLPFARLSPEVWRRVKPLVEQALAHGESVLLHDQLFCIYRNGYAVETFLSFCCNPLVDRASGVQGVMLMVTETTDQVINTRRTAALRDVSAVGSAARTVEDAWRLTLDAVARHTVDIPFALLYDARSAGPGHARLVASAALAPGMRASPSFIVLDASAASTWPIRAALEVNRTQVVDDLPTRFDPLPSGGWPLAPRCAAIVPLTTPGRDKPDGVLIAGISARHEVDAPYLDFIDLIAKQVVAVVTGARLREEEERELASRAAARLTEAKRRARMRALKARFAGALEERTRLAREIHDTLLQGVTGIALQLRAALPGVQMSSDEVLSTLERIANLAEETSREARQVVWDIRPNALDERAFIRAVEFAARRVTAGAGPALHLKASGTVRQLESTTQEVVLRIVQESMANVVRHASARVVHLTLNYGSRRLRVTVVDDGRGFEVEPDFRSYTGHWGLVGMTERAEQIGGSLHVRSTLRRGTTVTLDVPIPAVGQIISRSRGALPASSSRSA